jgi:hypothetical protein
LSNEFEVKDSGNRQQFDSGMVRDTTEGKINFLLIRPGPMFRRWAEHLSKAAAKYDNTRKPGEPRNWQLAEGMAEYERFQESAARHFELWLEGETDEDHAAGIFFNVNGAEYVKAKLETAAPCARPGVLDLQDDAFDNICPIMSPDRKWYCEIPKGHEGLHEAPAFTEPWCDPV